MITCDVTLEKRSAWSAWLRIVVRVKEHAYGLRVRVTRGGFDLRCRCGGLVMQAVQELSEVHGLSIEDAFTDGWKEWTRAIDEMEALAQ